MAGEGTSYEGGGGGAGGKFRKRPFRRPHMTPYDRPPTALRNPSTNGWLSKLVDPASKLISASAHLFFSSVLRKRLPPPPPSLPLPQPPEANQESGNRFQEAVTDNPPGVQGLANTAGGRQTNSFDGSGVSELEQMVKQKAFTRSEIDRLTELLRSKTVDLPNGDEDNSAESNLPQPLSAFGSQDKFTSSPMQENRPESQFESHRFPVSTPIALDEDIAAPAELAKAYMGSRSSKASPSVLGLHMQPLREEGSLLNNVGLPSKSPVMSLVPRAAVRVGVPENGFMTPRSRGRSAIYNMARTPYSRVHPTVTQKGTNSTYDGYGGPSASSSSQFAWERDAKSGSKQLGLKRRSSALEDNFGSVGPIRRLRQKTNLSIPQNWRFPASGSPLSSRGAGLPFDSAQLPMRSAQKLPLLDESNNGISPVGDNEDNSVPGPSYAPVPSRSTEMASKILQQLEKLVPKEKSSEGKVVAAREKSPSKLTPNMLRGQALRSLEDVDSSKILHNAEDGQKLKDVCYTSLPAACDTSSLKQDRSEENHSKKLIFSRDTLSPAGISTATVSVKEIIPGGKAADSFSKQFVTQPLQKKWAFQMSAHEDFLELDDEIHSNDDISTPLAEEKKKLETSVVESKAVSSELMTGDKPSSVPEFKAPSGPVLQKSTDLAPSDWTVVGEKKVGFTFPNVPASSTISQPVMASSQSTAAFDKIVPPKELGAHPPLFSSSSIDKVPSLIFSSSSSVGESSSLKSSALLESKPESSKSVANVFTGASDVPKNLDLGKGDNKNMEKSGDTVGKLETSISSALSTSMSTSSIFSFGALTSSSSLSNGSLNSSPSIFASPAPVLPPSNFTNSFTNVASSTVATISTNGSDTANASDSGPFTSAAPSFVATPIFKFGSTSAAPSNFGSSVLTTSIVEPTDSKAKTENETTLGNQISSPFGSTSSAIGSTGSSIFGFSASATSSANSLSQSSRFGTSSEPLVGTQASPAGSGVTSVTQSTPVQFGSSAASPIFGTSGISSFSTSTSTSTSSTFGSSTFSSFVFGSSTSSSSVFGSSTSSSSVFGSSTSSDVFGLSTSFGQSSQASSSETNSVSSGGATSSLFSSNWQPVKSPVFSSTFNTPSPATGFSFSASSNSAAAATNSAPILFGPSTGAQSGSIFSFSSSSATASSSPVQPVFGSSVPVFTVASGNGDQMSMEDTMAEDPVQATSTPTVPVFGQPPISTPSSGFVFGSAAPSGGLPFQFGGQQNQSGPQNTSVFQPSGSLEFNAGGSFSLGSSVVDKANRKIVKVKHKSRRR